MSHCITAYYYSNLWSIRGVCAWFKSNVRFLCYDCIIERLSTSSASVCISHVPLLTSNPLFLIPEIQKRLDERLKLATMWDVERMAGECTQSDARGNRMPLLGLFHEVLLSEQHYDIIAQSAFQSLPTGLHLLHRLRLGLLQGPAILVGEDKRLVGGQHQPLPLRLQRRVLWQRPSPQEPPLLHLVLLLLTCVWQSISSNRFPH